MFDLSGQVKGLLLSWCAGVCDGTGKIEVRIGGGLVFIMSHDVIFQRHTQYSKTREHLIEYFHKFVLCIHIDHTGPLES